MATADALLLVLSCEMALSRTELDSFQTHLRHYADKLFVLWNRYDAIWGNPEEIGAIESRSEEHLHPIVQADRVLFISAREQDSSPVQMLIQPA